MKKIFTLLFVLITIISIQAQNYKQVKIYLNTPADIEVLVQTGLEFDHLHFTRDNAISSLFE